MVLENCDVCFEYWIIHGRNMAGYQFLIRDQHIPEAHRQRASIPSYEQSISKKKKNEEEENIYHSSAANDQNLDQSGPGDGASGELPGDSDQEVHCQACLDYWVKNGQDTAGYNFLSHHLHIPGAHDNEIVAGPAIERQSYAEPDQEEEDVDVMDDEHEQFRVPRWAAFGVRALKAFGCGRSQKAPMGVHVKDDDVDVVEDEKAPEEIMRTDTSWYFTLYNAAMAGDWEMGEHILKDHPEALRARIRRDSETALHVAVGCGARATLFVRKWLELLTLENLEMVDGDGCTPLGIAAKVGNVEAGKLLVKRHSKLLYLYGKDKLFPIHNAAEYGQKEMLLYLLQVTRPGSSKDNNPYDPVWAGPELLRLIIKAEFYDAALILLDHSPKLATSGKDTNLGLSLLAENTSVFSCGRDGGLLQPFIYTCVPQPEEKVPSRHLTRDIESYGSNIDKNLADISFSYNQRYFIPVLKKLHQVLWGTCEKIAPLLKNFRSTRLKHHLAEKLVKRLSKEAATSLKKSSDATLLFKIPLLLAASNGIHEIVAEISQSFPDAIWYHDNNNSEIFRLAIESRQHNVYNLMYEMGDLYTNIVRQSVVDGDNILHLAGKLAPPHRLRMVNGAALQMQRELQWYKEIESLVQPACKSKRNNEGKTPQEVFTESHHDLMEEGEKWMKDTANSCTVAAALIATIVFAAAITVPGGNNGNNGQPMFASENAFIVFGVADALSLFSSSASILMFLSILTSRYAEEDFLHALPKRLIIGLFTLFLSIASMMVAFSSTLYLIFGDKRRWILSSIIASSAIPVALFASMQFSLLAEMIKSTYGSGIFKTRKGVHINSSAEQRKGYKTL